MTPQDTLARLDEIRARNEARTQGEWDDSHGRGCVRCINTNSAAQIQGTNATIKTSHRPIAEVQWCYPENSSQGAPQNKNAVNDAAFIAAASRDIPALLALVEWQQGEIKRWRDHYHVLLARESVQQERTAEEVVG